MYTRRKERKKDKIKHYYFHLFPECDLKFRERLKMEVSPRVIHDVTITCLFTLRVTVILHLRQNTVARFAQVRDLSRSLPGGGK